ncbi:MAG TPA: YiiX/YebB-like N1pC/P60 family cysteine hydrolase [Anaerolineae bacterium]|jgi:hypothetical protein|nr:YiiX/YebB-like N1pC/P60 family cysteine hydrolase [Anaerolineae bacterium]
MQLQIAVTYSEDILGRLARWWGMTWTHVGLRYRREAPGSGWRVIEATMTGIKDSSWQEFIAGSEEHQLYRVRGGLSEAKEREIVAFGWGNVGKRYAFWWIAKLAWRLLKQRFPLGPLTYPSHVCSSLVANCFLYAGINLVPAEAGVLVTPDEVVGSALLEKVPPGAAAAAVAGIARG